MTICESCPFATTGQCRFYYTYDIPYCTREALEGKEVPEVVTYTSTTLDTP